MFSRKSAFATTVLCLAGQFAFATLTNTTSLKPVPSVTRRSPSLPSEIITTDGKVYHAVKLLRTDPDGLLVRFQPDNGGIGLAKLKFAKLPQSLQTQFGYNPLKASAFEQEQARALAALSQKMRQEEKTKSVVLDDMSQRPNLAGAVSVNAAAPTVSYTYFLPGKKPDIVGEYAAVTGHHYTCHADFTFQARSNTAGQSIRLFVESVKIELGLSVHIIEPEHPYDFLSRHEEGHRKLYEHFYRFAPQIAGNIGKTMIGREFNSAEADVEAAKAKAQRTAENLFRMQYLANIEPVAREANQYYDQLTDPGRGHVDVDKAIQEAIAKYGKAFPN